MNKVPLSADFGLSRIVHGQMRIHDWKLSIPGLLSLMEEVVDMGVTSFDHADIYGKYTCEAVLGEVLSLNKGLRERIEIVTKCGIRLITGENPGQRVKYYDYSYDHIITSVNNSLRNFRTDRIDLLLLHRPAPFFEPEVAAKAFSVLKREGKVLHFGVSNFTAAQYDALSSYTEEKLVTNQVEISPYCLEHFENGNIDFFMKEKIKPMAWSPMAGGKLMNPADSRSAGIMTVLEELREELNVDLVDKVIYAWLLHHPATIIPVVGSGNSERIRYAVEALDISMSLEQWYRVYIASMGKDLP